MDESKTAALETLRVFLRRALRTFHDDGSAPRSEKTLEARPVFLELWGKAAQAKTFEDLGAIAAMARAHCLRHEFWVSKRNAEESHLLTAITLLHHMGAVGDVQWTKLAEKDKTSPV